MTDSVASSANPLSLTTRHKTLTETRWDYDLRHNLVVTQEETTPYGWKNYQYDTNDQLLHRRSDRYSPETYYYDAAANLLQTRTPLPVYITASPTITGILTL
ncbi:Uncharacterised protein [Providencia stuartii]|nr:Uncharacterised protein [Providencia stuartii]